MSADRVRWEHIQRVFEQCNRNVSETARRLNMHRRTLQRILNKRAPRSERRAVQVRPARVSNMIRQARTGGGPAVGDRLIAIAWAVRTLPGET